MTAQWRKLNKTNIFLSGARVYVNCRRLPSSVQTLRVALRRIDLIDIAATRALQMLCAPGTPDKHPREIIPH